VAVKHTWPVVRSRRLMRLARGPLPCPQRRRAVAPTGVDPVLPRQAHRLVLRSCNTSEETLRE